MDDLSVELETAEAARQPTLKTIAALTGYSITAVSRALQDAHDISQETKERVRLAAREVGYRPNRAGLRLRTGKTQVISLILNTDEEIMGLTSMLVNGISNRLRTTNYHLVVTPYSHVDDPMDPVKYVVETRSADGVILSRTEPNDRRVAYLAEHQMPFATHGRTNMGLVHPWHDFDTERFAYDSVASLVKMGATRIGLIGPPLQLSYAGFMRKGFASAINDFGIEPYLVEGITLENTLDSIEAYICKALKKTRRPDGFVCGAGSAALATVAGIELAGLEVGRDVFVASKQANRILHRFRPSIQVINEDFRLAGFDLADFVLKSIAGEPANTLQRLIYETQTD
jgi:LacI family transcriptional regulator